MDSPKEDTQSTAFSTEFWTYIMKQVLPYMGVSQTEDAGKDKDITNTKKSDIKDKLFSGNNTGGYACRNTDRKFKMIIQVKNNYLYRICLK